MDQPGVNDVTWTCRFHPTDWWHEVGCPHQEWTKEQLLAALVTAKYSNQVVHKKFIESFTGSGSAIQDPNMKVEAYN
jgi:rhamnogalacturonyl hydrolase YesR